MAMDDPTFTVFEKVRDVVGVAGGSLGSEGKLV